VIESLGVKFCEHARAPINPEIANLFAGLWPEHAHRFGSGTTCIPALGWYWTLYHESIALALDRELLGWYRVEGSNACEVARLAGFDHPDTAVYPPSVGVFARACGEDAQPPAKKHTNRRNHGTLRVDPATIDELDSELGQRIRRLAERFGYAYDTQPHASARADAANATAQSGSNAGGVKRSIRRARKKSMSSNYWRGGPADEGEPSR
jgi:hypothetical protein